MLTPLPLGLGLRYVRARQHQYFVSFMSWVSLAGIGLGVTACITILSIMNGFEGELRSRLLALAAHATLPGPVDAESLRQLAGRARQEADVVSAEPFIEAQGLLSNGAALSGAVIRGIDAGEGSAGATLAKSVVAGSIGALAAGSRRVALGRALAAQLQDDPVPRA
jgi:lipoprotein-releasing system permease protein